MNQIHQKKIRKKKYLFYKKFEILSVKGQKLSIFEQDLHEKIAFLADIINEIKIENAISSSNITHLP